MRLQYGRPAENELGAVGLDLRQELAGGLRGSDEVSFPQFCAEIADCTGRCSTGRVFSMRN
jgi:hypothetical protein